MVREDLYFWDYDDDPDGYAKAPPHLKGTSAVQFIRTSNITIHSLDELKRLYLNVFSCQPFDAFAVRNFVREYTGGRIVNFTVITRI
jgi:S-adenosylmethionine/arginine decarboxylase-like enzyme